MNFEFRNLKELYERLKPALRTKTNELKRIGFNYIKEEDIWNCLKETKWSKSANLDLADMVDDILNTDKLIFDNYFKDKSVDFKRKVNLKEV